MRGLERRILGVLLALGGVLSLGTLGYATIEGWPVLDAVYMTVITIGSVGYEEVHPLSSNGRLFTIGLIVAGLGVMGYGLSTVTAFLVEGQLTDTLRKRRMERKISSLREHVILVGGGETGRSSTFWGTRRTARCWSRRASRRPAGSSPPFPRTRTTSS